MVSADSKGINKAVISIQKPVHVWAAFVTHMFSLFSFSHPKLLNAILGAEQIRFQHLVNRIRKLGQNSVISRVQFCLYTLYVYISLRFGCSGLAMVQEGL